MSSDNNSLLKRSVSRAFTNCSHLAIVLLIPSSALAADTNNYRTEYNISIFGLTIAKSTMDTIIGKDRYSLKGKFSSSGLARIFDQTDGSIAINGLMRSGSMMPVNYTTAYKSGKKNKRTTIRFNNGNVSDFENIPPIKKHSPWSDTTAEDLKSVLDPISAMIITAANEKSVCTRNLQIFDGQTRAKIQLSYQSSRKFSAKGYSGNAITCSAKFIPVSGYQKTKKSINYLANKSKITISFASLNSDEKGAGIYAPIAASVGTQIGTVHVSATRFELIR